MSDLERAAKFDQTPFHAGETETARRIVGHASAIVSDLKMHVRAVCAHDDSDASRLGVPDHIGYRLLTDAQQCPLVPDSLRRVISKIQVQAKVAGHHHRQQARDGSLETVLLEQCARKHL
ncbi:MAG TPA: hypothetical protein VJN00_01885, partial [Steroidobacteraceae bacterium]|nr:hypothetical protein [Steroidobacteraceae bacterium]